MRFARIAAADGGDLAAIVDGDVVHPLEGTEQLPAADFAALVLGRADGIATGPEQPLASTTLLAPLRPPSSIRDFMAFEGHVANARRARGRDVPDLWYELPVFYFSNPHTVVDPDGDVRAPRSEQLDYELELGIVVGRDLVDADAAACLDAVAGFTVYDDFSARDLQRREMQLGLGPAKGKDFAQGIGPVVVTPDELRGTTARPEATMVARVNGQEWSRGDAASLHFDVGELLAHAAADSVVPAGSLVGSGTVAEGCILELSQLRPDEVRWLVPGDVVELEVEGIGVLRHRIVGR